MATTKAYNVKHGFAEKTKDGAVVFFTRHNAKLIPELLSDAKIKKHLDGPAPNLSAYDVETGDPLATATVEEPATDTKSASRKRS